MELLKVKHGLVFRKLYGVLPVIASTIDYRSTISLLEEHATIVSSHQDVTTQAFHDRFQDFISVLDRQVFAGNYLETNQEPAKEYGAFFEAVNKEVSKAD